MELDTINSMEQLRDLYDTPLGLSLKKQQDKLDKYSIQFLELSPFSVLSTANAQGTMDCSPRGDYPGFIQVLNDSTIAIPDRPGNNRLDSLSNIIENPYVGLLVLVPGFKECLRINGTAKLVTNSDLLERCTYKNKQPKLAICISVDEVFFHCAKAITRSKLWNLEAQQDRSLMPSFGKIMMGQVNPAAAEEEIVEVEALIEHRLKTGLY